MLTRPERDASRTPEKKRRKLPLAILLIAVVCLLVFLLSRPRLEPDIVTAVDRPLRPKKTRPPRPTAPRSAQAQKMNKTTDIDVGDAPTKSYRCVKDTILDEAAGILWREYDWDCDGTVDDCVIEELNEYGETVRRENYKNCGDEPNRCTETEYNEYGEETALKIDLDCNGVFDECHTFKRNDHGDITEMIIDKGCDGLLEEEGEEHGCFSYVYDENGMITYGDAGNCGEEPENCTSCEYDLAAGIRREKWDLKCDGTIDFCWVKIYRDDPYEPDGFVSMGCDDIWRGCSILSDDGVINSYRGHEVCAKKFDELVKRNRGR